MIYRLSLIFIFIAVFQSSAQIVKPDTSTHWRKSFKSALNLNQASFSSNWKSGGVNSLGFNALINYKANYKVDRLSWDNEIDLLYGMVNNAGQGYRKTLDRVFVDSKVGYSINKKWGAFGAMNFMTQFAPGYKYSVKNGVEVASLISSWLAPGFFTTSLGLEYNPASYFKLRMSPVAPRITIVKNSQDYSSVDPVAPYGVVSGETIRYEWLAAQMLAEFNKDVATNINLKFRYLFFANFEQFSFKRFDHRLDLNLTAKVNRFINVSLGSILLYDYDQDASIQLSQAFSLGILYTYRNFEK